MRKRNGVILTVIGIVFFGFIFYFLPFANAEVPVSRYDEFKNTKDFKLYIKGVGTGFSWANTLLRDNGQQPLYCPPSKLEVTAENYLDILRLYIEKKDLVWKKCLMPQ